MEIHPQTFPLFQTLAVCLFFTHLYMSRWHWILTLMIYKVTVKCWAPYRHIFLILLLIYFSSFLFLSNDWPLEHTVHKDKSSKYNVILRQMMHFAFWFCSILFSTWSLTSVVSDAVALLLLSNQVTWLHLVAESLTAPDKRLTEVYGTGHFNWITFFYSEKNNLEVTLMLTVRWCVTVSRNIRSMCVSLIKYTWWYFKCCTG